MTLTMTRNLILGIGWPVLIAGSIYLFIKGREVYRLIKGSLVGRITKTLVYTMLVEMYSLGIVCTAYMFARPKSVYLILPVFLIWFVCFIWALKVLIKAQEETEKIAGKK